MPKILIVPAGPADTGGPADISGPHIEIVDLGNESGHVLLCELHTDDVCPDIEPGDTWWDLGSAVRHAIRHVTEFEGRQR